MTDPQPTRWERITPLKIEHEWGDSYEEFVPLSEAEAKVERLEEARHAYEKERDWLEGKLNECESERDEARAEVDHWRRSYDLTRDERNAAEARIEQLEGAIKAWQQSRSDENARAMLALVASTPQPKGLEQAMSETVNRALVRADEQMKRHDYQGAHWTIRAARREGEEGA